MIYEYNIQDILNKMFDMRTAKLWMDVIKGIEAQEALKQIQQDLDASAEIIRRNTVAYQPLNRWFIDHVKTAEFIQENFKNTCIRAFDATNELAKTQPNFGAVYNIVERLNRLVKQHNQLCHNRHNNATKITDTRVQITALLHNIYTNKR